MTAEFEEKAREIVECDGTCVSGHPHQVLTKRIAAALADARRSGFREGRDAAARTAADRAAFMNRLGSDAKMTRTLTHAEIQAERVLEARQIEDEIRALEPGGEAGKCLPEPKCWHCSYYGDAAGSVYKFCDRPDCGERGTVPRCAKCGGWGSLTVPHPVAPDLFPGGEVVKCPDCAGGGR